MLYLKNPNHLMKKLLLPIAFVVFTLPSCVSKKKFTEAEGTISMLRRMNNELSEDNKSLKSRLDLMEAANSSAAGQIDEQSKDLEAKAAALQAQQERIAQMQEILDKQKRNTELLRQKMANALTNFSSDQLSVFTKDGKVYVSLSEKLLFPSGSAEVNKEGKDALSVVANALKENPDINVNIEGHTDTVPIKNKYSDNWALSVARSTAIVRLLTNDYGVNPIRVTASGRSQYEPVADNTTPEGRAKNRRTEIILAPKLDELMNLIHQD